jgi:hypothetical protein
VEEEEEEEEKQQQQQSDYYNLWRTPCSQLKNDPSIDMLNVLLGWLLLTSRKNLVVRRS